MRKDNDGNAETPAPPSIGMIVAACILLSCFVTGCMGRRTSPAVNMIYTHASGLPTALERRNCVLLLASLYHSDLVSRKDARKWIALVERDIVPSRSALAQEDLGWQLAMVKIGVHGHDEALHVIDDLPRNKQDDAYLSRLRNELKNGNLKEALDTHGRIVNRKIHQLGTIGILAATSPDKMTPEMTRLLAAYGDKEVGQWIWKEVAVHQAKNGHVDWAYRTVETRCTGRQKMWALEVLIQEAARRKDVRHAILAIRQLPYSDMRLEKCITLSRMLPDEQIDEWVRPLLLLAKDCVLDMPARFWRTKFRGLLNTLVCMGERKAIESLLGDMKVLEPGKASGPVLPDFHYHWYMMIAEYYNVVGAHKEAVDLGKIVDDFFAKQHNKDQSLWLAFHENLGVPADSPANVPMTAMARQLKESYQRTKGAWHMGRVKKLVRRGKMRSAAGLINQTFGIWRSAALAAICEGFAKRREFESMERYLSMITSPKKRLECRIHLFYLGCHNYTFEDLSKLLAELDAAQCRAGDKQRLRQKLLTGSLRTDQLKLLSRWIDSAPSPVEKASFIREICTALESSTD